MDIAVVYADQYISEIGSVCMTRIPELHGVDVCFIIIVDINKQNVSFRTTRNDVNLSKIAKRFGGGGHPQSAGAPLTDELKELLKVWER